MFVIIGSRLAVNLDGFIAVTLAVYNGDGNIAVALFNIFDFIFNTTRRVFTIADAGFIT